MPGETIRILSWNIQKLGPNKHNHECLNYVAVTTVCRYGHHVQGHRYAAPGVYFPAENTENVPKQHKPIWTLVMATCLFLDEARARGARWALQELQAHIGVLNTEYPKH